MPPAPSLDQLKAQVDRLAAEMDRRCAEHDRVEPYYENLTRTEWGMPKAITEARLTRMYRYLMPVAEAPWGSLIVDSKLDRLEVSGVKDGDSEAGKAAADAAWGIWQDNYMDSESKLAHGAALLDGRCNALIWKDEKGNPDIALDDMTQMVVEHAPGRRHVRTAALRRWKEGEKTYATLYRPEGLYKFQAEDGDSGNIEKTVSWKPRPGVTFPETNILAPFVPVVEIRVNGRLKQGIFPHARGEFAHCTGLVDRINLLTFLGLVVAVFMGFPIRGVIGDRIRRETLVDDDNQPIVDPDTGKPKTRALPPIENQPGEFAQFEKPDARTFQFEAADRRNLSVFAELDQLAVISKTARHYFPLEQGMSNLSADAIVASEGGMLAAVTGHKASLGEGWEDTLRLGAKIAGVELSTRAEMVWKKHESRSLAEQADAFVKLVGSAGGSGLPWMAAAEYALNASQDEIRRWQTEEAGSALGRLVAAASNGNGLALPTG